MSRMGKWSGYVGAGVGVLLALAAVVVSDQERTGNVNPQRLTVLAYSVPAAFLIALCLAFFRKLHFRFTSTDGWMIAFCGYWFVSYYTSGSSCSTFAQVFFLCLSMYFLLRLLQASESLSRPLLLGALYGIGITEAVWGLGQLYLNWPSYHSLYKFTGSLFNPGPYSGLLATILPLALWQGLHPGSSKILRYLSCCGAALIVIILPAGMSRSAWIAAISGCSIVLVGLYPLQTRISGWYQKHKNYFWPVVFAVLLFIGIAGYGIYSLKKDSADGRILMWKVSLEAMAQNPWTGAGPGRFAGVYGEAQARYFKAGKDSPQEKYVAGCPSYGFNEYLQIGTELGLTGIFLFAGLLVSAFRQACRQQHTGLVAGLTAFLLFAFFSYPFSVLPLVMLFMCLLALCSPPTNLPLSRHKQWGIYAFYSILCAGTVIVGFALASKQKYFRQWVTEKKYFTMNIYKGTVDQYQQLYPHLKDQAFFLFEYGQCLSKTEQYEKSIEILTEGSRQSSDPMFFNIIGKNYQALQKYEEAEEAFLQAYYRVPNRLYPLYLLAKLYAESGQQEKAVALITQALELKTKVMSPAIREMQEELKRLKAGKK